METIKGLIPFLLLFVVFWLFFIRPQKLEAQKRKAMLEALKAGDEVETVGRIFGTVDSVDGDKVCLRIGVNDNTKIRIHLDGIARVITNDTYDKNETVGVK